MVLLSLLTWSMHTLRFARLAPAAVAKAVKP
jgi:hypothetical protein